MLKYLSVFFLFLTCEAFGQTFYVCHSYGKLSRITIKDGSVTGKTIATCEGRTVGSIAVFKNSLYVANGYSQFKGSISGNTLINCTDIANIPLSNALTVDVKGLIYSVNGADLFTTNDKNVTKLLGTMPFVSAGDLAFLDEKLYMASTKGIVEVNINNPSLSKLIIPSNLTIYGITTVAYSSTKNKLLAMSNDNNTTDVYEVDITNRKLGNIIAILPFEVADAASDNESGAVLPISIASVETISDCPYTGKGTVKIICDNALSDYSYTLNGVTNTTGVFTNVAAGTYKVVVKSAVETVNKNFNIKFELSKPTLKIAKINPNCVVKGSIQISAVADEGLYTIKHNGNIYSFDNQFKDLAAGNYHFEILNKQGCKVDEVDVTLLRDLCMINVSEMLITEECDKPGFAKVIVNTSAHPDTYKYQLDEGILSASSTFNDILPGNHKITITGSDDEKVISINVPDYNATKPHVQIDVSNLLCDAPATVKLAVANSADLKILHNNSMYNFDHVFNFSVAGVYHFEILKVDGCKLKVLDIPIARDKCEINLLASTIAQECDVAYKGRVQVNSEPHTYAYTYKMSNGITNTTGLFTELEPGEYSVNVSSIEDTKVISVTVPDYKALSPIVHIDKIDAECDLNGSVKFNTTVNSEKFTIKLNSSVYPFDHQFKLNEGGYDFIVFKPNGCMLDSYHVDIAKLPCDIMKLPSAFTPNGDGINDVFEPNQGSDAVNYNLKIYSRDGVLLFNSKTLQNGWRGDYNGKAAVGGVYYWVVTYTNNTGNNLTKSGYVTLIR